MPNPENALQQYIEGCKVSFADALIGMEPPREPVSIPSAEVHAAIAQMVREVVADGDRFALAVADVHVLPDGDDGAVNAALDIACSRLRAIVTGSV